MLVDLEVKDAVDQHVNSFLQMIKKGGDEAERYLEAARKNLGEETQAM